MATNPMQRRARNSFLAGMLVTLIIAVVVVAGLFYYIMNLKNDITSLKKVQTQAYVLTEDVPSGNNVTADMFQLKTVITQVPQDQMVKPTFFDSDDEEIIKEYKALIDLPAGAIITPDMLVEVGNEITPDMRLVEYNMILLPTELVTGNYIDIRLVLPGGQSYIVVSKKYVEKANLNTIWLRLREEEILTLGNAIVESYIIEGSKIEATIYVQAGTQDAATPTYAVSPEVLTVIERDPNVEYNAREALKQRYTDQQQVFQREQVINPRIRENEDNSSASVASKIDEEISRVRESRENYLTELGEI